MSKRIIGIISVEMIPIICSQKMAENEKADDSRKNEFISFLLVLNSSFTQLHGVQMDHRKYLQPGYL